MADNIIILEIVIERATPAQIAAWCSSLTNNYYSANAIANNAYTFSWGSANGLSGRIKLTVGSAALLLAYNESTQKVEIVGTCAGTFDSISFPDDSTLLYSDSNITFTVQFHLIDGASIEITVRPTSNTTITAEE